MNIEVPSLDVINKIILNSQKKEKENQINTSETKKNTNEDKKEAATLDKTKDFPKKPETLTPSSPTQLRLIPTKEKAKEEPESGGSKGKGVTMQGVSVN